MRNRAPGPALTVIRRSCFSRQSLRLAVAAPCVLSLAACFDGYPTEDVPQIDPARMTQAQLLAALNALGGEPHLGKRWRYALHANCELEVSVRNGDTERRRVVLEGAEINSRSVDGVSEIRLVPESDGETQAVTVLETRKWSDTVRARSLLTYLEVGCGRPAVPAA
jgi:hypothetical protein